MAANAISESLAGRLDRTPGGNDQAAANMVRTFNTGKRQAFVLMPPQQTKLVADGQTLEPVATESKTASHPTWSSPHPAALPSPTDCHASFKLPLDADQLFVLDDKRDLVVAFIRRLATAAILLCCCGAALASIVAAQQHCLAVVLHLATGVSWFYAAARTRMHVALESLSPCAAVALIVQLAADLLCSSQPFYWSHIVTFHGLCLFLFAVRIRHIYDQQVLCFRKRISESVDVAQEAADQSIRELVQAQETHLWSVSCKVHETTAMITATLEQFSPVSILTGSHELVAACSIPVPVTSVSALSTLAKQLCHISSEHDVANLPTRENTPPTISKRAVLKEIDIGSLIQMVGDAFAGPASKLGVHIVIYHRNNHLCHRRVIGHEDGLRQVLFNLLCCCLEASTPGASIEIGLCMTDAESAHNPLRTIALTIIHSPSPALPLNLKAGMEINIDHASQLLEEMGGHIQMHKLDRNRTRLSVAMDLAAGRDADDQWLLILERQTYSIQRQLSNPVLSHEPTLSELSKFITRLRGLKMVLHAPKHSVFATRLTSCLASWNADISHVPVSSQAPSEETAETSPQERSSDQSPLLPATSKVPQSVAELPIPTPAAEEQQLQAIPPAFLLIDDDMYTLERKLDAFYASLPSPEKTGQTNMTRKHKHTKGQYVPTAIIYFVSLGSYTQVRELVQHYTTSPISQLSKAQPRPMPRIVVVPKPAGPRRFLTAMYTAWHNSVIEPVFTPIATSPISPRKLSSHNVVASNATPTWPQTPQVVDRRSASTALSDSHGLLADDGIVSASERWRTRKGFYTPPAKNGDSSEKTWWTSSNNGHTELAATQPTSQSMRRIRSMSGNLSRSINMTTTFDPTLASDYAANDKGSSNNLPYETDEAVMNSPYADDHIRLDRRRGSSSSILKSKSTHTSATRNHAITPTAASDALLHSDMNDKPLSNPAADLPPTPIDHRQRRTLFDKKPTLRKMPRLSAKRSKAKRSPFPGAASPPIHVLLVEDNMINQAILCEWMKKQSITYSVASNGQEAVEKWKNGGFHLVLMDLQLPVMSGLEATKVIREMEREKKIGVLPTGPLREDGVQTSFRSPVIIVALTASSNESVRLAALTAGCNDFLTKPVSLEWLGKKIVEWGCMQALVDFDGWLLWRRSTAPAAKTEQLQPSNPVPIPDKDDVTTNADQHTYSDQEIMTGNVLPLEMIATIGDTQDTSTSPPVFFLPGLRGFPPKKRAVVKKKPTPIHSKSDPDTARFIKTTPLSHPHPETSETESEHMADVPALPSRRTNGHQASARRFNTLSRALSLPAGSPSMPNISNSSSSTSHSSASSDNDNDDDEDRFDM